MENLNLTLIGAESMTTRLSLLLRNKLEINTQKLPFNKQLPSKIKTVNAEIIILAVGVRNVAYACKTLEEIKAVNRDTRVIILSKVKDPDLMFFAMKLGIRQFILDEIDDTLMLNKLRKELSVAKESRPQQKILCIGAHPDDVEIGCGGTLKKHQERGDEVTILTLTGGAFGGEVSQRQKESECAAKFLKANLIMGSLNDTEVSSGPDTISIIAKAIEACSPDIIYTHSLNDTHQDHRATHYATLVAARKINKIFAYLAPSGTIDFHPRYFEHVEDFMEDKMKAINCFTSQTIGCGRPYLKQSIIHATAEYWGRFSSYGLVEPFEVIRA